MADIKSIDIHYIDSLICHHSHLVPESTDFQHYIAGKA